MGSLLRLNVGGTIYITTRSTLTNRHGRDANHYFSAMFGGDMQPSGLTDEHGNTFIDRDGRLFASILNYLRDGTVGLPTDQERLQQLRIEAQFFGLDGLVLLIDAHVQNKEQAAAAERTAEQQAHQQPGLSQGIMLTGTAACYSDMEGGDSRMEIAERIFEDLVSVQQQAQQGYDEFAGRDAHLMHPGVEDDELGCARVAAAYSGVVAAALQGQAIMLRYLPPPEQYESDGAA